MRQKKIIHIDMDAFYASVEQRDNPSWKGKPVVVGGSPNSRGVVSTASYEARKFGIHSAMPTSRAYKLCPEAIFVYPRFSVYKEVSRKIQEIFYEYTDLVEPLSLDEAYLDVTENKKEMNSAITIAKEIKNKIYDRLKLTASAGVSNGKFLAKIASGKNKPNGLTVILPEEAESFLEDLPIGDFFGIGKMTEKKLLDLGIRFGKDLKSKTGSELQKIFGKQGMFYYNIVRGVDNSEVIPHRERKSVGAEETFPEDYLDKKFLAKKLEEISLELERRLIHSNLKGRTLTLKIKFSDFQVISRSVTSPIYLQNSNEIYNLAYNLFLNLEITKKIRLIGISLTSLNNIEKAHQPGLFE